MRLIDADELMKSMYHRAFETDGDTMWQSGCWVRYRAIEEVVKEQPTIEPMRKKGKWIKLDMHRGMAQYKCSACNSECYVPECMGEPMYMFCPDCGADMRKTDDA